jgi:two-component system sensor histidine kinase YesM
MSVTLRQLIDENYKVRLSEQEARLQTLMMQFNPHFLYNTLNVINWVALRGNTKKASTLIVSLSRMLRYTCDNRQERTKFSDDMEWLKQYLMLMEARFEGLFTVEWDVEEVCLLLELPKLFMQPLLENSILHGFGDRKHGGEIQIRARIAGGDVVCEVQDNGVGMTKDQAERVLKVEGESIGLYNTNKRIQLMFGEGYGLTIESSAGCGCLVRVLMRAGKKEPNKTQGY